MSFDIFVSGNGGYKHGQTSCLDEDDINILKLAEEASNIRSKADLRDVGASKLVPSADASDVAQIMGKVVLFHLLTEAVDILATKGTSDAYITVVARQNHWFSADVVKAARYNFNPGEEPGLEFIKRITPALKATEFNTLGVLFALTFAIGDYTNKIRDNVTPRLNIQLTH